MRTSHKPRPPSSQARLVDFVVARSLPKREKARTALAVLNGTATFAPTIRNMAALFDVCESYIQQEKWVADHDLLSVWASASEDARAEFLDRIGFSAPVPRPTSSNGHARGERRFSSLPPVIINHVAE